MFVGYLFSFHLRWSVLGMTSDFLLYPGCFGFYVVRLQILSMPSIFEASSDSVPLGREESLMLSGGV